MRYFGFFLFFDPCLFFILFTDKRFFTDGAHSKKETGFYSYGSYCQFVYALLQFIVSDSNLPAVEDWDNYMNFTFTDSNVIGVDEFLPNSPLREVLQRCQIGTPNSFLLITIVFFRSVLQLLLGHSMSKSKLLRGLSSFDPSIMCHSSEEVYTESITSLVNVLLAFGWLVQEDRDTVISEYRGYLLLLRQNKATFSEEFVAELFNDWCFLARKHLVRAFKLSYLCSEKIFDFGADVTFSLPGMGMSRIHMISALNCLRSAFDAFGDLEGTLCSDKSLLHVRGLLDRKDSLFTHRGYNVFDFLERRDRASLFAKLTKSCARFDPRSHKTGTSKKSPPSSKTKAPPKAGVAFIEPPGPSRPREKLVSQSSSPKKSRKGDARSRSASPKDDSAFALPTPKGNFRKSPQK